MSRPSTLSLILVALLGFASCGGNDHEALAKESITLMQDLGDTLAKVTDKSSAEKQVDRLETIVSKMKSVHSRMERMDAPSEEDEAAMSKALEADMGSAMQKMTQEMARIAQNPEIMQVVGPVLEKLDQ